MEEALKDVEIFHWPVIVKPTDSSGSKGVSRVDNPINLPKAIAYAQETFRSKKNLLLKIFWKKWDVLLAQTFFLLMES